MAEIYVAYLKPETSTGTIIMGKRVSLGIKPENPELYAEIRMDEGRQVGFKENGKPLLLPVRTTLTLNLDEIRKGKVKHFAHLMWEPDGILKDELAMLDLFAPDPYKNSPDAPIAQFNKIRLHPETGKGFIDLNPFNRLVVTLDWPIISRDYRYDPAREIGRYYPLYPEDSWGMRGHIRPVPDGTPFM